MGILGTERTMVRTMHGVMFICSKVTKNLMLIGMEWWTSI